MSTTSSAVGISNSTQKTASETLTGDSIMGKDDFLEMLTMQLKCQDPLNPMKNEEFAAQLAQFSQLETLQSINENIQTQIILSQSMNNSYMISLIGKNVKSYGDGVAHTEGESNTLNFELSGDATDVSVSVLDSTGTEVAVVKSKGTVKAGERAVLWDGKTKAGEDAKTGSYTFKVTATGANGTVTTETISTGLVKGISYSGGTPYMVINGQNVALTDVISVEMYEGTSSGTSTNGDSSASQSSASSQNNQIDANLARFISRITGQ